MPAQIFQGCALALDFVQDAPSVVPTFRTKCDLEGADAFFDDEVVDADVHGLAKSLEVFFPFRRPVVGVAATEEIVPDVLRLPEVYFEGHLVDGAGDDEMG